MKMEKELSLREAAGIFDDPADFDRAIEELLSSGFDRAEISVLASQAAVEAKLGHRYERTADVLDEQGVPRISLIPKADVGNAKGLLIGGLVYIGALAAAGPIIVAGGSVAAAVGAALAAGGTGGVVGGFLGKLIGDTHGKLIEEQLEKGGLVLWVSLRDEAHERRAIDILRKHHASEIEAHTLLVPPKEAGE